jgi:hypothetical protein
VPRELFGQRKKAISTLVFCERRLIPQEMRRAVETLISAQSIAARARYAAQSAWFRATMAAHQRPGFGERWLLSALRPAYRLARSAALRVLMRYSFKIFEHTDPFGLYAFAWSVTAVSDRYRQSAVATPSSAPSELKANERA